MNSVTTFVTCFVMLTVGSPAFGLMKVRPLPKDVVLAIARDVYGGKQPSRLNVGTWSHVELDLNHDGKMDYVIAHEDPDYCGSGGCGFLIFVSSPKGYRSAYNGGNFYMECWASKVRSHGFSDLVFKGQSYGSDYLHLLRYDGRTYIEIKVRVEDNQQ